MASPLHPETRPSPAALHEALHEAGLTVTEVAALFGVSRQTVHAWKRRREYQDFVALLARDAFTDLKSKARADLELAHGVLLELATDRRTDDAGKPVTPAGVRRESARDLIQLHERLSPLVAEQGASDTDAATKALEAIRTAKAAAEARRAAQGAPKAVETNV
jgi:transcriptional regulator with XRE-family HTH domain